jgi:hypothetical protein
VLGHVGLGLECQEERVPEILAGLVLLGLVALVAGAVTGRVRARSCCSPSDARRDARMRAAFDDEGPEGPG